MVQYAPFSMIMKNAPPTHHVGLDDHPQVLKTSKPPRSSQRVSPTTELRKANLWGHSCVRRGVMHCFEAVKQAICLAHWHLPKAEAAACRTTHPG